MGRLRLCSLFALLASVLMVPLLHSMPAPYEGRVAGPIAAHLLDLMPGGKHGSPFPPDLSSAPFLKNDRLKEARRLFQGQVTGSESVAVMRSGELLMLDRWGYMRRAGRKEGGDDLSYELVEETPLYIGPGRPLGFHPVEAGRALVVCDSLRGLLRIDLKEGNVKVLANRITSSGEPLTYANDLDVAWNDRVYFTSSTAGVVSRNSDGFFDTMRSYMMNLLAGDNTGKLLEWDPESKEVRVLMDQLFFPNGVAMSHDGMSVLVVETNTCRVLRYWLRGEKKGAHDVFIEKLPGMPDGMTRSVHGGYWISLVAPLSPLMRLLGPWPWLRQLLSHVAMDILPFVAKSWGCAVRVDVHGTIVDAVLDADGEHVSSVSAVTESEDGKRLFLGNLQGDFVSVVRL